MFCAVCGAENPAEARLCASCGAGLAARCSRCGASVPPGARFCPGCGQAMPAAGAEALSEPKEAPPLPPGERKQVTVLFADFAGFTAFAHESDAEDVRDYMEALWRRLDGIITAHGGLVEKHIGDAIMAVFGAKQAREDDPAQAVRAALAMQNCLRDRPGPEAAVQPRLQMRIGVHTGLVVVGPLGTSGEFAATGDTVNLANRLEQGAPEGGVLLSQDTYRHVFGLFDVQALPPLRVKGRPDPVQTYQVLRARSRSLARTLRGVQGVETEMVGREAELERLQKVLHGVLADGRLQMITIVGEAGIGKSRLLREFQKWTEAMPQVIRLFYGRASAEMMGLPFSLMRDVFSARFEIQDSDPPAVAREKFQRGLVDLLAAGAESAGPSEEWALQATFIGQLLGWDFSASPLLEGILNDTEQIHQRAFHYLSQFFRAISQGRSLPAPGAEVKGVLLLVEDIHWSDDGSLDLLEHLARTSQDVPLMIVCTARPTLFERRPSWGAGLAAHAGLDLEPLSRQASLALVASILRKTPEIPQALRELILGGAEGIPFFIEEIIQMLIDQRVILPGADQWRVEPQRLAAARVPATLTGVLQARLDVLTAPERAVLQRASVVGRVFWDSAVERLSMGTEPRANGVAAKRAARVELDEALAGLRRKELIFRRESSAFAGTVEYVFKHELLRNVTYESLLRKSRRNHHARVAAWLIDCSGERISEFAGLVASHLEQAGQFAQAAAWYGRAGQQARTGYAPAAAIDSFRKALALLPAGEAGAVQKERIEWHEGLGEALVAQARFNEALEAYHQQRALAEALGDPLAQARAWNGLAYLQERLGKNRASIACAERAEALAHQAGEPGRGERVRALHLKGWAFYRLSDAPAVLELGDQTLKLCTQFNDRRGLAASYKLHGVAHLQLAHFREADRFFTQGLALCQDLGDRRNTAAMYSNLGESARMRGDYQAATELYQKALTLARQIGHRDSEVIYLSNLCAARLGLGQFAPAEADLRQAIALTANPNSCALAETYTILSLACLGQGKLAQALETARRALNLARESENDLYLGGAWRTLGEVVSALKAGKAPAPEAVALSASLAEPGACFAESLRVFKKINAEGEQACTLRAWAHFDLEQGRVEESRKRLEDARSLFLRLGMAAEAEQAGRLLGGAP